MWASTRVWIEGGPGSGKTTLARWARRQVEGWQVVEFGCYKGEADLSLAALASLVRPLRPFASRLPPPARDAFESVVGGAALLPDRYMMSVMVLELLAAAADDRPLLVVVDDVQWMDTVSAQTLGFVVGAS